MDEVKTFLSKDFSLQQIRDLCNQKPYMNLKWHPVTPKVGHLGYNEADCIEEYDVLQGSVPITNFFKSSSSNAIAGSPFTSPQKSVDNASSNQSTPNKKGMRCFFSLNNRKEVLCCFTDTYNK